MSGTYFIKFGKVYQEEEEDLGLYYECEKPYLKNKKKLKRTRLEFESSRALREEIQTISEDV